MSLQELEGTDWGDPETAETPMIRRVLMLRRKPLEHLADGEIRLAISQKVGLLFILELAMERLQRDPLLKSDFYPGDVLAALVRLDEEDWRDRTELRADLARLFREAIEQTTHEADAFREGLGLPPSHLSAN